MKVVIMAGGKGTRISSVTGNIPKPMIRVGDMPVLEMEITNLKKQGFEDAIITVGHLGHAIMDYFGDGNKISPVTGESFGVNIAYYEEKTPLGNAGALYELKSELTEDFLLLNADAVFDIDFNRFVKHHKKYGGWATLFTHPNNHPYDSGLIVADDNKAVTKWLTKEERRKGWYRNRVNAGLHILSPNLLEHRPNTERVDLDRQILKPLSGTGRMLVYDSPEYVKDMGTPERYKAVCKDFARGIVQAKNLFNKQKAIFLDRDGTINKYVGFLRDIDDFELLPGVAKAIREINEAGYLCIVVTNQPVVARGEVSVEELEEIHNKMETLLGAEGAYVDAIYYCPHHPDKGFVGERSEYKMDCTCRKPKPGMLLQAAEKYNIDLKSSWMVGDSKNDMEAGITADCRTAYVGDESKDYGQDVTAGGLLEFVEKCLKGI